MRSETIPANATSLVCWNPLLDGNVHTVVLGLSKDPNPKITVLLFWRGCRTPWAVAKLAMTERAAQSVEREAAFLREVHQCFSGDVLRTIPRRYSSFESGLPTGSMVVEALPGLPLSSVYARAHRMGVARQAVQHFSSVEAWLSRLHPATTQRCGPIRLDAPILEGLIARFPSDPKAQEAVQALTPIIRAMSANTGPKTVVHGDLWLGNVLVDDRGVTGVIDWESAEITGEPLRDVVRFAITYALYLDRRTKPGRRVRGHNMRAGDWGAGITYLLAGEGWFPDLARGFLRRCMERLGADPTAWRELVLLGVADVVVTADDDEWAYRHLELLDKLRDLAC